MDEGRSTDRAARRPGRPRLLSPEQRSGILVAAAERVFIEKGYHAATMADIAAQAGMSKKTVYQLFTSKEQLFEQILTGQIDVIPPPSAAEARDPRASLVRVLDALTFFLLSPNHIAIAQLVMGEAQRSPEMSRAYHRQVMERGKAKVLGWIRMLAASRALNIVDTEDAVEEAAHMLFGLALGDMQFRLLLKAGTRPSDEEIELRVRRAVGCFLQLFGTLPVS